MTPTPNTYHQRVSKQLGFLLVEFIEKTYQLGEVFLAPTDVYFGEMEVYQPDIIVVAQAICNAIFAATGKRIRELPISKIDLSRA